MSFIHKNLVLYMGASILAGSLIGSLTSRYLPNEMINLIYGVLAVIAALLLIPNKGKEQTPGETITFNKMIAVVSAFVVGIVSGIVGAGGAFILIPILFTVIGSLIGAPIGSHISSKMNTNYIIYLGMYMRVKS